MTELSKMTEEVNEIVAALQKAVEALYQQEKSKHGRKRKYKSVNIQTTNADQSESPQD